MLWEAPTCTVIAATVRALPPWYGHVSLTVLAYNGIYQDCTMVSTSLSFVMMNVLGGWVSGICCDIAGPVRRSR